MVDDVRISEDKNESSNLVILFLFLDRSKNKNKITSEYLNY